MHFLFAGFGPRASAVSSQISSYYPSLTIVAFGESGFDEVGFFTARDMFELNSPLGVGGLVISITTH